MEAQYHIQMTRRALGTYFSETAMQVILAANTGQDSLRNLLRGEFHFDANAFQGAYRYADAQRGAVLKAAGIQAERVAGWQALGRWSHALQDFYSHTNYVAMWRRRHPGGEIDPLDPELLDSPSLYAARVYYPLEALTYFKSLRPLLRRLLPADSHANMNLDSPARGPLFADALTAAEKRTAIEFRKLAAEIDGAAGRPVLNRFLDRPADFSFYAETDPTPIPDD